MPSKTEHSHLKDGAPGSVFMSAQPCACALPNSFPCLQELSPASARLVLRYQKSLQTLGVGAGARLVLAVSGGADSTALACLTALVRARLGCEVHMLCCDHGLRKESTGEAAFVMALGKLLAIPCSTVRLALDPASPGLEEKARKARYAALEKRRLALGARAVLLAHHAEDLSEDIVMRLVRGTGWPGLGGMQAKDDARHLLRPLLGETPQSLRALLLETGIPHCEDASNQETRYTRNRVRHVILPLLKEENPSLTGSLQQLACLAGLDAAFFAAELAPVLKRVTRESDGSTVCLSLPEKEVRALPPSLHLRLLMALVHSLCREGIGGQARAATLFAADRALRAQKRPVLLQLPGGITIRYTGARCEVAGTKR